MMHISHSLQRPSWSAKTMAVLICLLPIVVTGCLDRCGEIDTEVPEENEVVLSAGMSITATTSTGTITITAGPGLERYFTWEGATRCVIMWPRTVGGGWGDGVYYPGPGNHWEEHNGIRRAVVIEDRLHFDSMEEAVEWLRAYDDMPQVYRDDGLFVGWEKTLSRSQLGVYVWQIYIEGEKPTELPGSQNDAIVVEVPE